MRLGSKYHTIKRRLFAHFDLCAICGNLEDDETCAVGQRLASELTAAAEVDTRP